MSRYMYGVEYLREIDESDAEHVTRAGRQLQLPSGPKYLPDAFDCILAKNVRVKESSVFSRKYYTEVTKLGTLSVFEIEIWCYRGGETIPKWIDRNSDTFGSLCFVRADLSRLSNSAETKKGANGQTYWTVVFSIEIHFGLTEFKARMKWNEDVSLLINFYDICVLILLYKRGKYVMDLLQLSLMRKVYGVMKMMPILCWVMMVQFLSLQAHINHLALLSAISLASLLLVDQYLLRVDTGLSDQTEDTVTIHPPHLNSVEV